MIGACHRRRRHQEFIKFFNKIDDVMREKAAPGVKVQIVMDKDAAHQTPAM